MALPSVDFLNPLPLCLFVLIFKLVEIPSSLSYAPINKNKITEKLTLTTSWSPKTIQTLIKRLVSKKALSYEKQSRVFVYTPLVQEDEYIRQESNSFLKRYYNGNLSSMLASYLEDDKLSSTEIDNLRHLLSKHQK